MNFFNSKTRIFLSGGTGLFGKWLLEELSSPGIQDEPPCEVVVLSRDPEQFLRNNPLIRGNSHISFVGGDVRNFMFPSGAFDFVIHAATDTSAKIEVEQPEELYSVIVDGTGHMLDFAARAGAERMLYISSGAVYGRQPPDVERLTESHPLQPLTTYGKGKVEAEKLCLQSEVDTVIARCFAFVGPYMPLDAHFAIGNFIRNCLRNEPIEIKGDGTPLRSYMYGSDLVAWLLRILQSGRSGEAYNVGSDEAVSILELAHLVQEVTGVGNEIFIHQNPVEGAVPARYVPSIQKAKSKLQLALRVGLKDAVKNTFMSARELR